MTDLVAGEWIRTAGPSDLPSLAHLLQSFFSPRAQGAGSPDLDLRYPIVTDACPKTAILMWLRLDAD